MSLALASRRAAISPAWVKNPLWRTARAVPSLDLPFADTKSLADAVTGQSLVTFTRASSATYVGSDGALRTAAVNEPRFDHNPTTGESLGLLVEEQRTNLLLRSEEFDNAGWGTKTDVVVTANSAETLAPNGTATAELVVANTANGQHRIAQAVTTAAQAYTFSVFAKAAGYDWIVLYANAGNSGRHFNLQNGTIGQQTGNVNTAAIQPIGNGWYRCSIAYTAAAASNLLICNIADADGNFSFAGNNTSGIYLWGAQLEAGAFATSYIPTTTAAATRSADVASITGTAFSSWYRQDEGTVFVQTLASANTNAVYAIASNGTVNQNSFYFDNDSGSIRNVTFSGNSAVSVLSLGAVGTVGSVNKLCGGYKANDFAAVRNGGVAVTDISGAPPVAPVQLDIGRNPNAVATTYVGTCVSRLTFWPARLPNSTLQAITQ